MQANVNIRKALGCQPWALKSSTYGRLPLDSQLYFIQGSCPTDVMTIAPTAPNSSVQIVSRQFTDVDEAMQILQLQRDVQIVPLSLAPFGATYYQLDFEDLTLIFSKISTPIQLIGDRRSGFVQFGLMLQVGEQLPYVHQHEVNPHILCGFDATRDADSIYHANTVVGEIQVRREVLDATLSAMRRDDLDRRFFQQELIHLPTTLTPFRRYLQDVMQLVKQRSPLLYSPNYRDMIIGKILPLLIDAIPKRKLGLWLPSSSGQQAQLVRRATAYIAAHIHAPLTLKDLYMALGSSRRTLFYSFESVFGVTPMKYIKVQRLQGARRSLKQSDPATTSIVSIAHQWGFWHSGQFAKAYKAQFGELPSETLQQGPASRISVPN